MIVRRGRETKPMILPRLILAALFAATGLAMAIDVEDLPPAAKHEVDFEKEIWPHFKKH